MIQRQEQFFERLKLSKQHRLLGLMLPLLLCVWGFVGFWSWWEHSSILSSNALVLEQLTAAVQAQTRSVFKQAESTLIVATHWIEAHPDENPGHHPEFIGLIEALHKTSNGLLELRMATRDGELLFVPGGQSGSANVSDRDYFRAQFDDRTRGLFIGEPVFGRVSKKWFLPVSAPVTSARSSIAVLIIVMELERFVEPLEAARIKPLGTMGVVRSDGLILIRSPQDSNAIGSSIALGQAWRQFMNASPKRGYESETSLFDRLPRLVSFAKVDDYSLVVYVSASKNDLLAPWKIHSVILGAVALLISVGSFLLISALVRALNSASLSEAIVRFTDEAIIGKSLDGIINSWNPGAERIFGYSESEILGQSILKLVPPDRFSEEETILENIRKGQTVDQFESIRLCKDGRAIHVSLTISPIRDNKGHIIGASKIAHDISAQEDATQQLRLTASVFTNTSEGIMITDRRGSIVEVNDAFTRITGYSREDAIGNSFQMFRSDLQGPKMLKAIRTGLLRYEGWKGELWSRRKNGDAYSAWLTISKVKSSSGKVRNFVALFSDVTELKLQQEALEHGAHFDALTDLPNRLLLSDRLHQAITMSQRHHHSLAVLYLDLDGFKSINDRYGHKVGDELLVAVSKQMKAALRDVDTLARMGGDEFVAVLTDIVILQDCIQMVTRLLEACTQPVTIQGMEMRVTASIGITLYPQDNAEADQLMRHADQAMYEAKRSGKNRFHIFDSAQDAEVKNRTVQQDLIKQGLSRQQFVLHYQPKVNMRTGTIIGAEALLRWQHPEKGLLLPDMFLPAIERHPLIETVGFWALESALKQMNVWKTQGLTLAVSVNISARQLLHNDFAKHLSELLTQYPTISPGDLELEVLETSDLDDITSTAAIMEVCQGLGVRFSIDDFGTGYSSLSYLRHLPVETLKIDQSFVRDMLEDRADLSIVIGIVGLAAAFHRNVIAEGVETLAHGKRLIELGCDLAQGYVVAHPMPADQLPQWCSNWTPPDEWTGMPKYISQYDI